MVPHKRIEKKESHILIRLLYIYDSKKRQQE